MLYHKITYESKINMKKKKIPNQTNAEILSRSQA